MGINNLTSSGEEDIVIQKFSPAAKESIPPAYSNADAIGLVVYPNPVKGEFNIYVSTPLNNVRIEIYNRLGSLVYSDEIFNSGSNTIELTDTPTGVYFVKVFGNGNKTGSTKFVKVE